MSIVLADRVQETTTTTGTGTINLAGAATQCQSFVSGIGSGNITYYTILGGNGTDWEVGIGTVTSGSPNTLSRSTILASSNSGSAISLTGTSTVFGDGPATSYSGSRFNTAIALSSTSIITRDSAGVYPATSSLTVAAGDVYKFRLKVTGLDSSHSTGLWILNGNTSAAAGYYCAFQEDGNIIVYTYNNGSYTSIRAAGSSTLSTLPTYLLFEVTVCFGGASGKDYVYHPPAGAPIGSNELSSTTVYLCGMAQAFADLGQLSAEKLAQ